MKTAHLLIVIGVVAGLIWYLSRKGGTPAKKSENVATSGIGGILEQILAMNSKTAPNSTKPSARAKNAQNEQLRAAGVTAGIQAGSSILDAMLKGLQNWLNKPSTPKTTASDPSDPMLPGYDPVKDPNYQTFGLDGKETDEPWTRNFAVEDPQPDPVYNYDLSQYEVPFDTQDYTIDNPVLVDAPAGYGDDYFGA